VFCKVKLILVHALKAYGGSEVCVHVFLTLALDGGERSASHPSRFPSEKIASGLTEQEAGWAP